MLCRYKVINNVKYVNLVLLKIPFVHESRSLITYGHAFNNNYRFSATPYFLNIIELIKSIKDQIEMHPEVTLHILFPKSKLLYRRISVFLSQVSDTGHDQIGDILSLTGSGTYYEFNNDDIFKILNTCNNEIKINLDKVDPLLCEDNGFELSKFELRYFLELLDDMEEKNMNIRELRSHYAIFDEHIYLGTDSNGQSLTLDNPKNLLLLGSERLIPPLIHNNLFRNTVIVSSNIEFWSKYKEIGGHIVILSAGDGIESFGDPQNYEGEFAINLLDLCRINLGFTHILFNLFDNLIQSQFKDAQKIFDLVRTISEDPSFDEVDLYFKDIMSRDEESDILWDETNLRQLSTIKPQITNIYGEIINKPYFQFNRGEINKGIVVIDTSEQNVFDQTLLSLLFLAMQKANEYNGWLILSDIHKLLDNKSKSSDLDKILMYEPGNRLILHQSNIDNTKNWFDDFDYSILENIHQLSDNTLKQLQLVRLNHNKMVLLDNYDGMTLFDPTTLLVKQYIYTEMKEEEEAVEEKMEYVPNNIPDPIDDEINIKSYLTGAIMSYLANFEDISSYDIYEYFVELNIEDILEELSNNDAITFKDDKYTLHFRFKNSIQKLIEGIIPEKFNDTIISDLLISIRDEFVDAVFNRRLQLIQNLIAISRYIGQQFLELKYTYHLSIGLYREMLLSTESKNYSYNFIISSIIARIIIKFEESELSTDLYDLEYPDEEIISDVKMTDVEEVIKEKEFKEFKERKELNDQELDDQELNDQELDDQELNDQELDDQELNDNHSTYENKLKEVLEKPIGEIIVEIDSNIPENPENLKELFVIDDNYGWTPFNIDYSVIDFRYNVPSDIFILTYEILKYNKNTKTDHIRTEVVNYVRDKYPVHIYSSIEDLIEFKMCRMRKKGLKFNTFTSKFKNRLHGKNIDENEYKDLIKNFPKINRDDIISFITNPSWQNYVRSKRKSTNFVEYNHSMIDNLLTLWKISHFDTCFGNIDGVIMAIINLPSIDTQYIDLLLIYFRLLHNQNLTDKELLIDLNIDTNLLRNHIKELKNSINNILKNGKIMISSLCNIKSADKTRVMSIPKIGKNNKVNSRDCDIEVNKKQTNHKSFQVGSDEKEITNINQISSVNNIPAPKTINKQQEQNNISISITTENMTKITNENSKLNVKQTVNTVNKAVEKKLKIVETNISQKKSLPDKNMNKLPNKRDKEERKQDYASGKNFINNINFNNYFDNEADDVNIADGNDIIPRKEKVRPLSSEIIKKIENINIENSPLDYIKDVLIIIMEELTGYEIDLDARTLVNILNKAGTEAKVAVNAFTQGLSGVITVYNNGSSEIKADTMRAYADRVKNVAENLRYDNNFTKKLINYLLI